MFERLEKIGQDLRKARQKKAEWEAKVKELERRYREEENTQIHDMVHAANLTPEQLAEIIRMAKDGVPTPIKENECEKTEDTDYEED